MTIHEFGQSHDEVVVLVHPSVVMWDYFEYVIPLMQEHYHLIIPALPGYDTESGSDLLPVPGALSPASSPFFPQTGWFLPL